MKTGTIYKITNKVNGKIYVGQTTESIRERFNRHKGEAKHCRDEKRKYKSILYASMRKHGIDQFNIEVLEENVEEKLLHKRERYWISKLNCRYPNGYNIQPGGRALRGADNPMFGRKPNWCNVEKYLAKLKKDDIPIIWDMLSKHKTHDEIGNLFNVGRETIWKIANRKTWTHITSNLPDFQKKEFSKAKLTSNDVINICKMLEKGEFLSQIAKLYNLDDSTIGTIASGKSWKHITKDFPYVCNKERYKLSKENLTKINRIKSLCSKGSNNPKAKLTEENVTKIVCLLDQGVTQKEISQLFNVSESAVQNINVGKSWSYLTGRTKSKPSDH